MASGTFPYTHPVIAIDGPAASGKSTVAKRLATRLHFLYVNTGSMYRGLTWWLQEMVDDVTDEASVKKRLKECDFRNLIGENEVHININGIDPLPKLRSPEVNAAVSAVSAHPSVRAFLVERQRALAQEAPLIAEGRDMATVVFVKSPYKFYIDADPEIRAARRRAQGETDAVAERDRLDSSRESSPLQAAPDAEPLDSGKASAREIVDAILHSLSAKGLEAATAALEHDEPMR